MLLVIGWADEAGTGGHRCNMAGITLAVQGNISVSLMINAMIGPGAANMTGCTGIWIPKTGIASTVTDSQADQGVGCCVVAGGAAVMHLVVGAASEGRGRVRMTDRTGCFYSN
jgi:hypothetical protein